MSELVASILGRPSWIIHEGWKECIAVSDQAFLSEKREWKRRLAAAHPDRHNQSKLSAKRFRGEMRRFRLWKLRQREWYWKRNLMPPDWRGTRPVAPPTAEIFAPSYVRKTKSLVPATPRMRLTNSLQVRNRLRDLPEGVTCERSQFPRQIELQAEETLAQ